MVPSLQCAVFWHPNVFVNKMTYPLEIYWLGHSVVVRMVYV